MINKDVEMGLFREQTKSYNQSGTWLQVLKGNKRNSHTHLLDQRGLENASQICLLGLNQRSRTRDLTISNCGCTLSVVFTKLPPSYLVLELKVHRAGSWDRMGREGGVKWESKGKVEPQACDYVSLSLLPTSMMLMIWVLNRRCWCPLSAALNPPGPKIRERS